MSDAQQFQTRSHLTQDGLIFQIRQSQREDASQIVNNINAVCSESVYLLTERYVPTPQWEQALSVPSASPDHLLLVPVVDRRVIGWCRIFPQSAMDMPSTP